jgi:sulfofructose kinase
MILGLGCIAYDRVLFTNAMWEDGKGRILRTETRFGGNVRTALTAAAGLGASTAYLATVSSESQWDSVLDDLQQNGVSTEFTSRAPGAHPALSTIIVTGDGERFIAYDDSSLAQTPLPGPAIVERALDQASVLMVDASTAPPGSLEVMSLALSRGLPVVLDAEREVPGSDIVNRMIALADHPILPLNFARTVTSQRDPEEIIEALWRDGRASVTITDGHHGAFVRSGDVTNVAHVPAFDVQAIDTVGCGDVFHGAYAVGLDRGMPTLDRVRLANAAAAIVAATPTGASRIPHMPAVDELLGAQAP